MALPDLESVWTRVNGLRVHARVAARSHGAPIVLQHGIGVSSRYMVPVARELAGRHRVYAPDLPGFGKSDKPPRALGVTELAAALAGWMDKFELGTATLVANSFGCQIAVDLAVTSPERVERLVLVGPTVDPYARTMPHQAARLVLDSVREPPGLIAIVAVDYAIFGPVRFLRTARHALRDRIEEKLPRLAVPTLVARGERDAIVSEQWASEAARLLPRGRLVVVAGRAHALNYNAPTELARLVEEFVAEG